MYLPRSRALMMSPIMVWESGMMVPIPKPCTARATTSHQKPCAAPARMDPQHENHYPSDVEAAPTVDDGELADDWDRDSRDEQRRSGDPGVVFDAAELGDDYGHGGSDDGLADRGDQHAVHQPDEDHILAGAVVCHLPFSPSSTGRLRRAPAGIPPVPLD